MQPAVLRRPWRQVCVAAAQGCALELGRGVRGLIAFGAQKWAARKACTEARHVFGGRSVSFGLFASRDETLLAPPQEDQPQYDIRQTYRGPCLDPNTQLASY